MSPDFTASAIADAALLPHGPSPTEWLFDQLKATALGCAHKDVDGLTEYERLAVCWAAGVQITITAEEGSMKAVRLSTVGRVGIAKIDGKFRVFVDKADTGQKIKFTTHVEAPAKED